MRINEPITQQSYAFPVDQTLVLVTDLKGCITYCNAVVEPARAGAQRRGFAVAASEVRSRAQCTATAAREITLSQIDAVGLRREHKRPQLH